MKTKSLMIQNKLIITLSIVIPLVVVLLFNIKIEGYNFSFLPRIYATINAITAVLLIVGLISIKLRKQSLHKSIMKLCLALSTVFLVMYVIYHMTTESAVYGGQYSHIYYPILISHILLSVVVIPLILLTVSKAINGNFLEHKRFAKFTFPIWLYVVVTGVIVYLMIQPYYV